jgi:hypothetical protein
LGVRLRDEACARGLLGPKLPCAARGADAGALAGAAAGLGVVVAPRVLAVVGRLGGGLGRRRQVPGHGRGHDDGGCGTGKLLGHVAIPFGRLNMPASLPPFAVTTTAPTLAL